MDIISKKDRSVLRKLAGKQMEIANSPVMGELRKDWELHGEFSNSSRPMVIMKAGGFADEILLPLMECEGARARGIEREMRLYTMPHEYFRDDSLVAAYMQVALRASFVPFNIYVRTEHAVAENGKESLGQRFISPIHDLEKDFHMLGGSSYGIDWESTRNELDLRRDVFGDILPVRRAGFHMSCSMMQNIVYMMGMESMFTAMCEYPDLFHRMMSMLTDDYLAFFDMLEREASLLPTADECPLLQGSYCFNDELPHEGDNLVTTDLWGYMDAQEMSAVSPAMFMEFVAPYYRRIIDRFGLLSYGCCEAVNPVYDAFLDGITHLRKLSISPWADEEFMGERLRGRHTVYMRKPSPNYLGVSAQLDEAAATEHITRTVSAARGCHLEIIQRDVYRIHNDPGKVRRFVEIIKKCCDRHKQ